MIKFYQESSDGFAVPKLSQSSLFIRFNEQNNVVPTVQEAIRNRDIYVDPESMKDVLSLMRLNGSKYAKKAAEKFMDGEMYLLYDKEKSQIPITLPFMIVNRKPFVFADRVVSNLNSGTEYPNLMADMEAAYYAAALVTDPGQFLLNRQVVLNMCEIYIYLWLMPLEQKLYMKGENLTKAELYIIAYFYKMIDGDISVDRIPFRRFLKDRVPDSLLQQIVTEVQNLETMSVAGVIELIKQINPIRYKDLGVTFFSHFTSACGAPVMFALECPQYLFLLVTSAYYKTKITQYALNKVSVESARRLIKQLSSLDINY